MSSEKNVVETPEVKIKAISKEVAKVETEAKNIVVKSSDDEVNASKFLIEVVKPRLNRINELVTSFTSPWRKQRKDALEEINRIEALFEGQIKPLEAIEKTVKRAIADFRLEEERKARAEEERKAKIREQANDKREEKGLEPIQAPINTVERAPATVKTDGGKSTVKKVWKFEVENYMQLSNEVIHEVMAVARDKGIIDSVIRKMVNEGARQLTGVRIYEDFDIGVSAKK